ncbi:FMN-dependent oxidoreductase (nitrilotriacetate monooxygenase family) [Ochrobactrum sp. 19YEA23]|uniref:LLM class flavin-dependent oxidoreductase n=1 Tax=Ochrobactrum sp. 19YEA23 TaxID=3039854 RepID=UPI00247AF29F|nr:FMN-dependent oxidoreductase (nitrilotriacetate monooxygenase family) [Ochrobactrum sp. 19YEA23]
MSNSHQQTPRRSGLILGLSVTSNGSHTSGWRYPGAPADSSLDIDFWQDLARRAEAAKIHFIFFADGAAVRQGADDPEALRYIGKVDQFEPLTLISALSIATRNIGFIATASTTYNEPYTVARKYASIDYISKGRVGWNVVTSWSEAEAQNFNLDRSLEHGLRYRRASEFVDVVFKLWNSWEDDAFSRNQTSGQYLDPAKLHIPNHKGEFFSVKGPLNVARPIQGFPVIAQAGSSEPGQQLAARTADLVYTAQQNFENARVFYEGLKARLPADGRGRNSLKILPGVLPIIGRTREEAEERHQKLRSLIHPAVVYAMLEPKFGDMSAYPLDGPIPDLPETNGIKSIKAQLDAARAKGLTIRELYETSGAGGHRQIVGTAQEIADLIEEWFVGEACDGFNIMPPYFIEGLQDIFDLLIPELQRRGLFHSDYEGHTLRENLGLERPAHPAAQLAANAAAE